MKKKCSECNKIISFGGSWEIDGRILCSACEKKIRSAPETGKNKDVSSKEMPEYLKKDEEIEIIVIVNVMGYNNKPQLFFSCEGGAWDWDLLSRNHFSAKEISI